MKLQALALSTMFLLGSTLAVLAKPSAPSLTVATDSPINDIPTEIKTTIPANLLKDNSPPSSRGVICKPDQDPKDCDDRVPMQSNNYPWSAIGRLQIGVNGHCTATLVEQSWILTNAHCVVDHETHQVTTMQVLFFPNLIDGKVQSNDDIARVTNIITGTDFSDSPVIPHPKDWALLKLDRPLGRKYGTIAWKAMPSSLLIRNTKKFILAGYSKDFPNTEKYKEFSAGPSFTAGVHNGCSIISQQKDKALVHNCDMRGGASGSAIFALINDQPYIVAINNAERNDQTANFAVNVNQIDEWFVQQQRLKSAQH
jgi:V8-like Glu-specific endopeptidase